VLNRKPEISIAGLGIERYDRPAVPPKVLHSSHA
jgi:D-amino-acid dehydrogenase